MNIFDRLRRLENSGMRVVEPEEPEQADPDVVCGELMREEARSVAFTQHFLPFLRRRIAEAAMAETQNLANHSVLTYWKGRKDALADLATLIDMWAGREPDRP